MLNNFPKKALIKVEIDFSTKFTKSGELIKESISNMNFVYNISNDTTGLKENNPFEQIAIIEIKFKNNKFKHKVLKKIDNELPFKSIYKFYNKFAYNDGEQISIVEDKILTYDNSTTTLNEEYISLINQLSDNKIKHEITKLYSKNELPIVKENGNDDKVDVLPSKNLRTITQFTKANLVNAESNSQNTNVSEVEANHFKVIKNIDEKHNNNETDENVLSLGNNTHNEYNIEDNSHKLNNQKISEEQTANELVENITQEQNIIEPESTLHNEYNTLEDIKSTSNIEELIYPDTLKNEQEIKITSEDVEDRTLENYQINKATENKQNKQRTFVTNFKNETDEQNILNFKNKPRILFNQTVLIIIYSIISIFYISVTFYVPETYGVLEFFEILLTIISVVVLAYLNKKFMPASKRSIYATLLSVLYFLIIPFIIYILAAIFAAIVTIIFV